MSLDTKKPAGSDCLEPFFLNCCRFFC